MIYKNFEIECLFKSPSKKVFRIWFYLRRYNDVRYRENVHHEFNYPVAVTIGEKPGVIFPATGFLEPADIPTFLEAVQISNDIMAGKFDLSEFDEPKDGE